MSALARSRCLLGERTELSWGGVRLSFFMRKDHSVPDDEKLSKDTNNGRFDVTVKNDDPAALFFPSSKLGQEFSFEIHPLPPPPVVEAPAETAQAATGQTESAPAPAPVNQPAPPSTGAATASEDAAQGTT